MTAKKPSPTSVATRHEQERAARERICKPVERPSSHNKGRHPLARKRAREARKAAERNARRDAEAADA